MKINTIIMTEMHRTWEIFFRTNWQNWLLERIPVKKKPSRSYLSWSEGQWTLIRLRKKSVLLFVDSFLFISACIRDEHYSTGTSMSKHRIFFNDLGSKITWIKILFVFVRFYFFLFDLQYIGIYFFYSFHLVCHWNIAILGFFNFVIYCFMLLC